MKRNVLFLMALMTVFGMAAKDNVPAIDSHSHIVTDESVQAIKMLLTVTTPDHIMFFIKHE